MARSYAEENGVPLLLFWSSNGCGQCNKMKTACNQADFVAWRKERKLIFVFSENDPVSKAFAKNPSLKFPYMRLYWPAGGVDEKFTGRTSTIPASGATLQEQLMNYVDGKLKDWMYDATIHVNGSTGLLIYDPVIGGMTMKQLFPNDYTRMTTVVLEDWLTELPVGFFDGCDNMESVTWPSTLVEFGIDAVPPKIRATLSYDANGFMIYNGWILGYKNRSASAVTIPEGIVGIGRGAFAEMYDLETVTMPESLRCIASGAFEGCTYIQELQFMSSLRYVGPVAFRDCSSLLRATFADGLENVGANAFEDCWQMQSVRLPYTVTNIGVRAFSGCGSITGVTVPTHVKTMQELFPASYTKIETAEVAEGETTVMDSMFAGCVSLRGGATQTDMSMIPNTVTNIGTRAFQDCTALTAFVVPDSVVEIGESVFQDCTALWNVTLSRSLSEIPDYAFYGCSMLETMVVPASVTYLGDSFFSGAAGDDIENALYYLCTNAPSCHWGAYSAIEGCLTTYVLQNSRSWDGRQGSRVLPPSWNGYPITYWTPNRFDVTFDANGGRFNSSGGSTWSEQQITDTTYALPSTEPTRSGWAFEGWWTEQTGGAEVRYTTLVTATRTHTLYAHWRSLANSMTVTFNSNGGTVVTPGTQTYVPGQTFGQFPVPTRRGYTFQGWWTEAVNGICMTEATEVPAADMELFAHWSPITYYVRFHANGGTGTMSDQPFTYDVRNALNTHTFTRTGFAFTGWATTPSGQVRYAENASVVNLEEVQDRVVDLYAVWSGVGYSVRFDSNGGTGIMDNQTIAVGETQNLWSCAFARAGYTFAGWAVSPTDAEAKKVTYRDGAAVKNLATSNGAVVPLYAVWVSEGQMVRISFNANGGSVSPDYLNCNVGTAVESFPTPTRPGFTFAGWWTAKSGGMRVTSIARVTAAQTFYAHWTSEGGIDPGDGSCTVTFNANGGSVSPVSRIVTVDTAVGTLPTPTRSGYSFDGWFTAANGGVQVTASTVVRASVTYYAHWTKIAEPEPEPTPAPEPTPVVEEETYGGKVENVEFTKAQTVFGALYDAKGNLVGTVELKFGKINKKQIVKVSGSATIIADGKAKKITAKAVNVTVDATKRVPPTTLAFKAPIGNMTFAMDADGVFTLKNDKYEMVGMRTRQSASLPVSVGGAMPNGTVHFNVDMDSVPNFGKDGALLEEALPAAEPVNVSGGKWSFGKAASLKYAKNRATGSYELIGLNDAAKPNVSGLKLTYTAKTGLFKGSFKLYATNEATTPTGKAPKLKKFTVNVIGFVVDGVGYGEATLKKPAGGPWSVTVE